MGPCQPNQPENSGKLYPYVFLHLTFLVNIYKDILIKYWFIIEIFYIIKMNIEACVCVCIIFLYESEDDLYIKIYIWIIYIFKYIFKIIYVVFLRFVLYDKYKTF